MLEGEGVRAATSQKASKTSSSTSEWRSRVCNQVWKGKQCSNRTNGCRFAHPSPCSNNRCRSRPVPGCRAFHPRVGKEDPTRKGNGKGSARKGSAAPRANSGTGFREPYNKRNSSNSKGSTPNSNVHLRERVEMMEKQLEMRARAEDKGKQPSYRDVAARGLTTAGGVGNSSFGLGEGRGGFGHVQPDPAMLSTVVAAVMAVLAGGKQHF